MTVSNRSRFGWHSGNVHAKNIIAGTFVISGAAGTVKSKAIVFPRRFLDVPEVVLTQKLGTQSLNASGFGEPIAKYWTAFTSGAHVAMVSGVTTTGFTAVQEFPVAMTEIAGVASGARFSYIAVDYNG